MTAPAKTTKNLWKVRDKNATTGARTHDILGTQYALSADDWTLMPEDHAVFFLKDTAFQVVDARGDIVPPMPEGAVEGGGREKAQLRPGEVIANFEELTKEALLARAKNRPGRAAITSSMTKPELLKFLHSEAANDAQQAARIAESGPIVGQDELSADELDKLLPSTAEMMTDANQATID